MVGRRGFEGKYGEAFAAGVTCLGQELGGAVGIVGIALNGYGIKAGHAGGHDAGGGGGALSVEDVVDELGAVDGIVEGEADTFVAKGVVLQEGGGGIDQDADKLGVELGADVELELVEVFGADLACGKEDLVAGAFVDAVDEIEAALAEFHELAEAFLHKTDPDGLEVWEGLALGVVFEIVLVAEEDEAAAGAPGLEAEGAGADGVDAEVFAVEGDGFVGDNCSVGHGQQGQKGWKGLLEADNEGGIVGGTKSGDGGG